MFDLKAFREQSLPTQTQVISQWDGDSASPVVSVICTAYNQENYIEDALKGFLMQKTNFPFEIIIHDDASSDKTTDIINDYVKKYPLIIKPILQENNQYSINGHLPLLNTIAAASGQYLALCEGDDFWIDKYKISKQVTALKENGNLNICFTKAVGLYANDKMIALANHTESKHLVFNSSAVIVGGGGFMPTPSIMVKKSAVEKLPEWFFVAPVGDYYIQIICSLNGALFLGFNSSVYRIMANGSWSSKKNKLDTTRIKKNYEDTRYCMKKISIMGVDSKAVQKSLALQYVNLAIQSIKCKDYLGAIFYLDESLTQCKKVNYYQTILRCIKPSLHVLAFIFSYMKSKK
ncbi:putative glycosyltransferase EpsH [Pseudoalteromonas sp. P1-13-1a]|uniref:glycosyltransferase family 2 protein n=1 Tax=Pseudoalteromonas sp. P1-13-1a TaxID=1723756 RepID=UPI0006D66ACB|nr:glycosyltransferase family A protein [Pseudoalteromonas sp. P1-13-1a]KPZ52381.1 putative glycosyltransferase EpsH [Pseudoalteromonas sp. P1-13-1a]